MCHEYVSLFSAPDLSVLQNVRQGLFVFLEAVKGVS